jgi:uncharacterized cupin superfamily protein
MRPFAIMRVDDLPSIAEEGVDWRPIQHFFGLTAFGINEYRATEAGVELIGDHDEAEGSHEEVYLVLAGRVRFRVGDESHDCTAGAVVAVMDPGVRRKAVALTADAVVLAVGNRAAERFETTWQPHHFEGVPTITDAPKGV